MSERSEILQELTAAVGEAGCGMTCDEPDLFRDEEGWKVQLEGFLGPWKLGRTVEEARVAIREYARMGFGLS